MCSQTVAPERFSSRILYTHSTTSQVYLRDIIMIIKGDLYVQLDIYTSTYFLNIRRGPLGVVHLCLNIETMQ